MLPFQLNISHQFFYQPINTFPSTTYKSNCLMLDRVKPWEPRLWTPNAPQFCTSVLLITKGSPRFKHCPNFASFELFWIETCSLHSFTSIANQKTVRCSVSVSYFTNIAVQKLNKVHTCAQDWTSSLMLMVGWMGRTCVILLQYYIQI